MMGTRCKLYDEVIWLIKNTLGMATKTGLKKEREKLDDSSGQKKKNPNILNLWQKCLVTFDRKTKTYAATADKGIK